MRNGTPIRVILCLIITSLVHALLWITTTMLSRSLQISNFQTLFVPHKWIHLYCLLLNNNNAIFDPRFNGLAQSTQNINIEQDEGNFLILNRLTSFYHQWWVQPLMLFHFIFTWSVWPLLSITIKIPPDYHPLLPIFCFHFVRWLWIKKLNVACSARLFTPRSEVTLFMKYSDFSLQ